MMTCKRMREIALATPELWQYVNIPRGGTTWRNLCERHRNSIPITLAPVPIYITTRDQCITDYDLATLLRAAHHAMLRYSVPSLDRPITVSPDPDTDSLGITANIQQACDRLRILSVDISNTGALPESTLRNRNRPNIYLTDKFLEGSSGTLTTLILRGIRGILALDLRQVMFAFNS
jgi:hypothetical protein